LPGLRQYIEVVEIATPRTMERFALSPEGAIYGFSQSVSQSGFNRLGQQTKINGLFLAGAWTRPGAGAQACFFSGLDAADLVLEFLKHRGI
jgi:prolycopene isomerase